jgi:hypothetical protein
MTTNERRNSKTAETMNRNLDQSLSIRYAELLRLRKAVRQAEAKVGTASDANIRKILPNNLDCR